MKTENYIKSRRGIVHFFRCAKIRITLYKPAGGLLAGFSLRPCDYMASIIRALYGLVCRLRGALFFRQDKKSRSRQTAPRCRRRRPPSKPAQRLEGTGLQLLAGQVFVQIKIFPVPLCCRGASLPDIILAQLYNLHKNQLFGKLYPSKVNRLAYANYTSNICSM